MFINIFEVCLYTQNTPLILCLHLFFFVFFFCHSMQINFNAIFDLFIILFELYYVKKVWCYQNRILIFIVYYMCTERIWSEFKETGH